MVSDFWNDKILGLIEMLLRSQSIVLTGDSGTINVATLNGAAEGALSVTCEVDVEKSASTLTWFNGAVRVVPYVTSDDADILAPTLLDAEDNEVTDGWIDIVSGVASFKIVPDTDEGVTKTYAPDDVVGYTIAEFRYAGMVFADGGDGSWDAIGGE